MECKRIQVVCVGLGILGLIAAIITCALPSWTVSSFTRHYIVTAMISHEGLWMGCVYQSTGQYQCRAYDSLLILALDIQAARAMTIVCCIVTVISLLLVMCIKNEYTKPKIFLAAGVGMLIAGVLLIIPVSWTANNVMRDSKNPLVSIHREIGLCIYIGWAGGVLLLLGGGLLCCFSRPRSGGTTKYYSDNTSTLVIYVNDI
ncbi:claudin-4-like [Pangasianodon hypophthalmus]|uniref:claudin-4-like n=1 Tax=Pangasianodon hypophthalmus TaxID=310915 RepID=UPI000EFF52A3|nr:claudin-4-like [Pangasianodon hypophthalmus]XP_053095343.1 claudin-4-like [Pangasianodon hypophthalmus]